MRMNATSTNDTEYTGPSRRVYLLVSQAILLIITIIVVGVRIFVHRSIHALGLDAWLVLLAPVLHSIVLLLAPFLVSDKHDSSMPIHKLIGSNSASPSFSRLQFAFLLGTAGRSILLTHLRFRVPKPSPCPGLPNSFSRPPSQLSKHPFWFSICDCRANLISVWWVMPDWCGLGYGLSLSRSSLRRYVEFAQIVSSTQYGIGTWSRAES